MNNANELIEIVGSQSGLTLSIESRKNFLSWLPPMKVRFENRPEIARHRPITFNVAFAEFLSQLTDLMSVCTEDKASWLADVIGNLHGAYGVATSEETQRWPKEETAKLRVDVQQQINSCLQFNKYASRLLAGEVLLQHKWHPLTVSHLHEDTLSEISKINVAVEKRIAQLQTHIPKGSNGPQTRATFNGWAYGLHYGLSLAIKKMKLKPRNITALSFNAKGKRDASVLFEKLRGRDGQYLISPLKIMANGYYLSGLPIEQCKEANLRKVVGTSFKSLMGSDAELFK